MSNTTVKQCLVCGKTFTPRNANAKYCGAVCRDSAAKEHRKQWELENNYKESQRIRMREARRSQADELKQARLELTEKERKERQRKAEERHNQNRTTMQSKADTGDTFARLILEQSKNGKLTPEYWELFKQYETEQRNHSNVCVNGIPLMHNNFALAVSISIEELGQIIITR